MIAAQWSTECLVVAISLCVTRLFESAVRLVKINLLFVHNAVEAVSQVSRRMSFERQTWQRHDSVDQRALLYEQDSADGRLTLTRKQQNNARSCSYC